MFAYSPAAWAAFTQERVAVDDQCVNFGGRRNDGSFCKGKAEASGWCRACGDELFPQDKERDTGTDKTGVEIASMQVSTYAERDIPRDAS